MRVNCWRNAARAEASPPDDEADKRRPDAADKQLGDKSMNPSLTLRLLAVACTVAGAFASSSGACLLLKSCHAALNPALASSRLAAEPEGGPGSVTVTVHDHK